MAKTNVRKKKGKFYVAVTKRGRAFVANGQKRIKQQITENGIAGHNVAIFLCKREGGDSKIIARQVNKKGAKFKIKPAHADALSEACIGFTEKAT